MGSIVFKGLGKKMAEADGMAGLPLVFVPHPIGGISAEQGRAKAEAVIDDVIYGLTYPSERVEVLGAQAEIMEEFYGEDFAEAAEAMNKDFVVRFWGDGLPLIPPTREKVDWMLTGTDRSPDDVVGVIEPGMGIATVKKIAINAVMAGCLPSYMPILITAVESIAEPDLNFRGMQSTQGAISPVTIINGPVAKQLNVNSGFNALGSGWRANATIGRAINLVLTNLGLIKPGVNDMTSSGTPIQYTYCFAENEEESPWEPWHVAKGLDKETSTVTIFPTHSPEYVTDYGNMKPESILNLMGNLISTVGYNAALPPTSLLGILMLTPKHAKIIAKAGWSRDDVKHYIYENWRVRWGQWKSLFEQPGWNTVLPPGWEGATDATLIPVFRSLDDIHVIVVGGVGGQNLFQRADFIKKFITKEIKLPKNWKEILGRDGLLK